MHCKWSKRVFDIIFASLFLLLLFPVILILSALVAVFLGRPVFFKQRRPGLYERPFYLYKFRTMKNSYDKNGLLLDDEKRLTPFGKFLRSTSLDELPELMNVIKGDMSLVGPRPLLIEYLPYYSVVQRQRHNMRPGITGWAQINGRNNVSWEKKFALDVWYVHHYSFKLDIKIIFLTIIKIIKRDDINAPGHATMTRFDLECQSLKETK